MSTQRTLANELEDAAILIVARGFTDTHDSLADAREQLEFVPGNA